MNRQMLELEEAIAQHNQLAKTLDISPKTAERLLDEEFKKSESERYGKVEAAEIAKGRLVGIRSLMDQVADKVVDRLEGTATGTILDSVEEIAEELGLPVEERERETLLARIDRQIFSCDGCGWWCLTEELNNDGEFGEQLCDDCDEDKEDD